jgi:hypothetical protein
MPAFAGMTDGAIALFVGTVTFFLKSRCSISKNQSAPIKYADIRKS